MAKSKGPDPIQRAMDEALQSVERLAKDKEVQVAPDDGGDGSAAPEDSAPVPEAPKGPSAEEHAQVKDQLLRLAADFDNFRKRARRERDEMREYATEQLLRDLLPVVDNFDRAIAHAPSNDPVAQGVKMVAKQLLDVLASRGVATYDSLGKTFDPERHEALSQAPAGDAQPGSVLEEIERGYTLHGRLLRPAKVVVAAAPAGSAEGEAEEG
jgi:molecular chaperone GrpE